MENKRMGLLRNNKGFTLIELIMVIVILGILAAVAIPKYIDMKSEASISTGKGITAGLRGAVSILYAKNVLGGTNTPYNITTVVDAAQISGVEGSTTGASTFAAKIGGVTYTWTLAGVSLPTEAGAITSDLGW